MEQKCGNCKEWDRDNQVPVNNDVIPTIAKCKIAERMILPEAAFVLQIFADAGHTCRLFEPLQDYEKETVL